MIIAGALAAVIACAAREPATGLTSARDKLSFHYDAQRTGWNDNEALLTPESVANGDFGLLWSSPQFDSVLDREPRLFASPLYKNEVRITAGEYTGISGPVVYAASHHGFVYAVSAFDSGQVRKGQILWRKRLINSGCGEEWGLLSTPVIDADRDRLYVVTCDTQRRFEAHALSLGGGEESAGWPVRIDRASVNAPGVSRNGSTDFPIEGHFLQRGALNLSADGSRLYVPFGGDSASGWIVAIDTEIPGVATAFSTTPRTEEVQGGMWASGGASVDSQGRIHIAAGANVAVRAEELGIGGIYSGSAHNWGQSIIQLTDSATGFELTGTYTPFNYCLTQYNDIDLGASGAISIDLDPAETSTPRLLALLGGKQGNAYLLDRDRMPGDTVQRPPCSDDPATDGSLHAPEAQPQFGAPGPISIFGPYSDEYGWFDLAKSRTTGAWFRAADGTSYLFATGSAKEAEDSGVSIPPGLVRLEIVTEPGKPAFLRIDKAEMQTAFKNPGSPIVTSDAGQDAIVWVVDLNAPRTVELWGADVPQPILYAFDALTLDLLWKSEEGELETTGKYNEPAAVNGVVYVGTDRIQAFGAGAKEEPRVEPSFVRLFDGESLNGWRGDERYWSAKDGILTGKANAPIEVNTFLIHERTFGNFELQLKYRFLTRAGNSGLQYRSRPEPNHEFGVIGYQANIVTPDANERFAMLWDEGARGGLGFLGERVNVLDGAEHRQIASSLAGAPVFEKAVKSYPEWNELIVLAHENRLVHAVNGYLAVDVTDNDLHGRAMAGILGLQLHAGEPMGVEFKDIEVREIDSLSGVAGRFLEFPVEPAAAEPNAAHGQKLFEARCATCHTSGIAGVPQREALAGLDTDRIRDSLTVGTMRGQTNGLSAADIAAIADYLTSPDVGE